MAWLFHAHNFGEYIRAISFTSLFVTLSCVAAERNKELLRRHSSQSSMALKKKLERRKQIVEKEIIWDDEERNRKGPIARILSGAGKEVNEWREYRRSKSNPTDSATAIKELPPMTDFEDFHPTGANPVNSKRSTDFWPEDMFSKGNTSDEAPQKGTKQAEKEHA
eukprot:CAMPEP_0198735094 /NCGR_PEP_ID=MMETSP1475-20131203/57256_1 /TAXON_ID= ORGANISM="Unidentified sp., Strain CCMP1999" /NCGR_SAMPLE_ID=MMETSP1475 /ASSEMBLY_ACC=CAM_ASM_001111 /LENGTH=164 /DNA_ID=CAMNT_0044498693 /DNA_START=178 /DNA_END=672 /DNA_ORIENTATION=-